MACKQNKGVQMKHVTKAGVQMKHVTKATSKQK